MEDDVVIINGKELTDAEIIVMKVALGIYKNIIEIVPKQGCQFPQSLSIEPPSRPEPVVLDCIQQAQVNLCNLIMVKFNTESDDGTVAT